MYYSTVIRGRP